VSITTTSSLRTALASGATTLARLYVITRTDGNIYRFTDHDADIVYDGDTYYAEASLLMSAIYGTIGGVTQTSEAILSYDSSFINEQDVVVGLFDFASVDVYLVDYENATVAYGLMTIFSGNIGAIENTHKGFCRIELRGKLYRANFVLGNIYMPSCRADLGDSKCLVDTGTITDTLTVTSVISASNNFAGTIAQTLATGYFSLGLIVWTGGLNSGVKMEIASSNASGTTQSLRMTLPMPFDIQIGDTATIYAGCDKRIITCNNKFSNVLNFRGEPAKPGADWVNGYVSG